MAGWIGKDGKEDGCKLASMGGAHVAQVLASLPGATAATRFHRVDYILSSQPAEEIIDRHVDFVERLTLVGFIDGYGRQEPLKPFVVFQTSSPSEAEALAKASPLATEANASVHLSSLDLTKSIWS